MNCKWWHKLSLPIRVKENKNVSTGREIHKHSMNYSPSCTLQLLPTILGYYTSAHLHTIPWGLIFILQMVFLYNVIAKFMVFPKSNLINSGLALKTLNPPHRISFPTLGSPGSVFSYQSPYFLFLLKKKVSSLIAWFFKTDKVVLLFISAIAKQTCQNFQDKMYTCKRNWHITGGPG